jgi:hypothetical protein
MTAMSVVHGYYRLGARAYPIGGRRSPSVTLQPAIKLPQIWQPVLSGTSQGRPSITRSVGRGATVGNYRWDLLSVLRLLVQAD